MEAFKALMKMNMKRRLCDGFIMGYNIIFPAVMIGIASRIIEEKVNTDF